MRSRSTDTGRENANAVSILRPGCAAFLHHVTENRFQDFIRSGGNRDGRQVLIGINLQLEPCRVLRPQGQDHFLIFVSPNRDRCAWRLTIRPIVPAYNCGSFEAGRLSRDSEDRGMGRKFDLWLFTLSIAWLLLVSSALVSMLLR